MTCFSVPLFSKSTPAIVSPARFAGLMAHEQAEGLALMVEAGATLKVAAGLVGLSELEAAKLVSIRHGYRLPGEHAGVDEGLQHEKAMALKAARTNLDYWPVTARRLLISLKDAEGEVRMTRVEAAEGAGLSMAGLRYGEQRLVTDGHLTVTQRGQGTKGPIFWKVTAKGRAAIERLLAEARETSDA